MVFGSGGGLARLGRQFSGTWLHIVACDKVFPQLVQSGPDDNLDVNYIGLIPVLIESIKEQQLQILILKSQVGKWS